MISECIHPASMPLRVEERRAKPQSNRGKELKEADPTHQTVAARAKPQVPCVDVMLYATVDGIKLLDQYLDTGEIHIPNNAAQHIHPGHSHTL